MKAKTLASLLCSLLGVAAFGADLSVANTYTYDNPYKLTANTECDELRLAAGAVLDLNGYNLIVKAGSWSDAALITNSVDGTTAHISMTPTDNNGWGAQFQGNLKFGGNLELTVCGIVNSNTSWGQRGFQNAHNTHTGGTVLDGYATNYVNAAESNLPKWNTADAFGTGPLTLKNGAILKTDANDLNPDFSKLIVDGDGTATNVLYCTNQRFDLQKPVEVTEGNTLHIKYKGRNTWERFMTGDLTGVKGKIIFEAIEDGCQFNIFAGAEYGTFALAGTVANEEDSSKDYNTEIRFNGSDSITLDDPIKIGMIESAADVTAADAKMGFRANFGSNTGFKNLQIGGSGLSGTYYGSIIRHSNGSDWNVEKAGAGTWTLGGNTHSEVYRGTTTLSGGTLKLTDAGRLGTGNLIFNGGTLAFAADATNTVANTVVATAAPAKVHVDEGGTAILSGNMTGATAGLEKTGTGMARFTGTKLVQNEGTGGKLMIANGNEGVVDITTWEGGLGADELMLDAGQTLDLNGRDMMVRKVSQSETVNGGSIVKNDSDRLATFTVGVGNGANANKMFAFQGNVRYVVTGSDSTYFRDTSNKNLSGTLVPNTHTGGTVISNTTNKLRFYSPDNFGTGPIILCNASLMRPSSNLGDLNFSNPWEFYGSNSMELQHYSGNGASINLKGPWSGDGFIHINNGFVPTIELNGDMADFTGVLEIAYKDGTGGFWMRGDNTNGLPRATLRIANVGNDATKHFTHLKIKPGNNATITHPSTITSFPIGHLVTDGDDPDDYVNSYIMNCQQWANSEWEIGALNESGTFAGWFTQETASAHLAIKKVGTGTWTWTSSLHTFDSALTVAEGRMNINSANLTNCAVVVKSGATLGGTGTLSQKAAVTVEAGGVLAGSLTLSAGVTFESGAVFDGDEAAAITGDVDLTNTVVEVADVDAVTDGQVFLSVTGTATGRPALSDALKAVTARDGQTGRWAIVKATADGVTTFALVWQRPGLIIHVR